MLPGWPRGALILVKHPGAAVGRARTSRDRSAVSGRRGSG